MTVAPAARGLGTKPLSEGCVFVLCSGAVFAELKLGLQRQNVATVIIGQHAGCSWYWFFIAHSSFGICSAVEVIYLCFICRYDESARRLQDNVMCQTTCIGMSVYVAHKIYTTALE
ncbi:hypothetical protein C0Q70_16667 [Pomacea canaliculata]|uniref:Uncharacterized protein n=1 Tax=Pomacea canaliculata TaxID=400727 RepID=A0A2T7NQF1_POMCA|nr:hypothetical protein C0Q70_16667 [Pomacea canaliculata]